MSLLQEWMQDCTVITATTTDDGEGGTTTVNTDGRTIKAAIVLDNSSVETSADARVLTRSYTVITPRGTGLEFHEVIRDGKGKYYRITSNGAERHVSDMATFQVEACTAENWEV